MAIQKVFMSQRELKQVRLDARQSAMSDALEMARLAEDRGEDVVEALEKLQRGAGQEADQHYDEGRTG